MKIQILLIFQKSWLFLEIQPIWQLYVHNRLTFYNIDVHFQLSKILVNTLPQSDKYLQRDCISMMFYFCCIFKHWRTQMWWNWQYRMRMKMRVWMYKYCPHSSRLIRDYRALKIPINKDSFTISSNIYQGLGLV